MIAEWIAVFKGLTLAIFWTLRFFTMVMVAIIFIIVMWTSFEKLSFEWEKTLCKAKQREKMEAAEKSDEYAE